MAARHAVTMETGGWVLLVLVIAAILYFLFHKTNGSSVSSTVAPTAGVPKVTSDIADAIASGALTAHQWQPGMSCGSNETLMDAGSGNLWCVQTPGVAS